MICTRAAFGVVGLSCANRLPLKTMIDNVRSTFFIFTPQRELTKNGQKRRNCGPPPSAISGSGSSARIRCLFGGRAGEETSFGFELSPFSVSRYGIGGLGTGATPQMADAQGGRGGVGISSPFPCLDGEQLGSVAGLRVMHIPAKVSFVGWG